MTNQFWRLQPVYCLILIPLALCAQNEPKPSGCLKRGAVVGREILGHTLMVKDRTGYLNSVELPASIEVWRLPMAGMGSGSSTATRIKFDEIYTNDLVCIEGNAATNTFTKITVVPRTELERAQREFALNWQASSVYGSILKIDPAARAITVMPLAAQNTPAPTEITMASTTMFRTYPSTALRINDAGTIRFEDLQVGDKVYIRGRRKEASAMLEASLLIKGGVRGIIGTLLEMGGAKVKIREFGTGKTLDISIPSTLAYRTAAELTHTGGGVRLDETQLATISIADLQASDTVLVVGTVDYNSNSGTGLGVIAQFGYFGSSPTVDGTERIMWILK